MANNGRNYKGKKGKGSYQKTKDFLNKAGSTRFMKEGDCTDGLNDIVWWSQNPQLLKDAANLSYANVQGLNVDFQVQDMAGNYRIANQAIPGIMKLVYLPTLGISKDGSSAVNNAMRILYSWVRHANSGSRNYEQSDLMTYVLATANMISYHAELTRLYGLAQVYSKTNRYVGKALIESLGYDFSDVVNHLADLRYAINAAAVKINSFAVPKDIYLYARHIALNTMVLADAQNTKAQLYLFQPRFVYKWSNVDADGQPGSSLKPVVLPGYNTIGTISVQTAIDFLWELIDALAIYEDVGLMSGDIGKAFGDSGLYHINPVPEDYTVIPRYDEVMLSQIHNANYFSLKTDTASFKKLWITQNENNIIFNPEIDNPYAVEDTTIVGMSDILDSGMEVPTPEFTMEATRLKANAIKTDNAWYLDSCGTEIITDVAIFTMESGDLTKYALPTQVTELQSLSDLAALTCLTNFDWSPIILDVDTASRPGYMTVRPFGDIFNYTIIDRSFIKKVNEAALLSALNVFSLRAAK